MGIITMAAFDFGVCMGEASYLASAEQDDNAIITLHSAQPAVDLLSSESIIHRIDLTQDFRSFKESLLSIIIPLRTSYENEMRSNSNAYANFYRLGLIMALAQGHTAAPPDERKQLDLLRAKLLQSQRFIKENLDQIPLNSSLYQETYSLAENNSATHQDRYAAVEKLRNSYRDVILLLPDKR